MIVAVLTLTSFAAPAILARPVLAAGSTKAGATNLPSIDVGQIHAAVFAFSGTGPFTSRWAWLADDVRTRRHERAK